MGRRFFVLLREADLTTPRNALQSWHQAGSNGKSVGAIWVANSLNRRTGRVR